VALTALPNKLNQNKQEKSGQDAKLRFKSQSGNGVVPCKAANCEFPLMGLGGFRDWLLMLEACEESLCSVAKTPPLIAMYKNALSRWREAGYPCPGEWPDTAYNHEGQIEVYSCTHNWMLQWGLADKLKIEGIN
jgi:hypothetical protein